MVVKKDLHSRHRRGDRQPVRRSRRDSARDDGKARNTAAKQGDVAVAEVAPEDILRGALSVVDAGINAIERTAWEARGLVDEAVTLWKAVEQGSGDVADGTQRVAQEARRLPRMVSRLAGTGWTLAQIAASYRMWETRRAFLPASRVDAEREDLHRRNARRFRRASLRHGGAFLKIGQLLSCRPDILPKPWIDELSVLQDRAAPVPMHAIRSVIEASAGASLESLYSSFDEEPIACASIGQVHRAMLQDGTVVAVKVQRPALEEAIELDMHLMRIFIDGMRNLLPPTDLEVITGEIERAVREELDYEAEARWITRARAFLQDKPGLVIPVVIASHSSRHVLVTRFIEGRKLTVELDALHAAGETDRIGNLLGTLLDAYFTQVLDAGFFQADPHPGNLLVTPDGEIVLLDFGCTMQLPESYRLGYRRVLQAAMTGDREVIATTLLELGFVTRSGKPDTLLLFADALLEHIREAVMKGDTAHIWPTPEELSARSTRMMDSANEDPVDKLPPEFIMLARVFGTLGGMFMHYKPRMDVARCILPHVMPRS